jgi:formylmethanofuran dehydrogenase subunit E
MSSKEVKIGPYSYEKYARKVEQFHGFAAPGLLIGGFMVEKAKRQIPKGVLYDALCETAKCLPDAIQLLTPCTIGNGWLKIIHFGRYALSLFDKFTGKGARAFLDQSRLEPWPEIKSWYLKTKAKKEQDLNLLHTQIRQAGEDIIGLQTIMVKADYLRQESLGRIAVCHQCGEAYPIRDGDHCRCCQGESPYMEMTACIDSC